MKVLMFGRGTIATLYGWALEKAGHQVEFYVRPGRSAALGSMVELQIRDGRVGRGAPVSQPWPITLREDLDSGHDYDLIVLSVNHDQLNNAVSFLSSRIGDATVLMFGNLWAEPSTVTSQLPANQVVWGFPGGGGGFTGSTLRGGVVQNIFMGFTEGSNRSERYQDVRDLFKKAGFKVSEQPDFRSWLWVHFLLDAALLTQGLAAGGQAKLVASRQAVTESVLLMREMIPLVKARGGTSGRGMALLSRIPAGLVGFLLQRMLAGKNMYSFIMDEVERTGHMSREGAGLYARDVLAEARQVGLLMPRLSALEPVFAV
ncbi:2-dehydropantoate 2-reductase N-terminal domain-containing protein [Kribbella yunnanensis]|uniref:2-dehydropantoate 2-reductase N-terminal domain-containing protein n=1 Tax=Kribbella yunnanensis TaxID=190194 RepID=A0ABP4UWG7_9ACTN